MDPVRDSNSDTKPRYRQRPKVFHGIRHDLTVEERRLGGLRSAEARKRKAEGKTERRNRLRTAGGAMKARRRIHA